MDKVAFDELVNDLIVYIGNNYNREWIRGMSSYTFCWGKFIVSVYDTGSIYLDSIRVGSSYTVYLKLEQEGVISYNDRRKKETEYILEKLKLSKMSTPEKVRYYWDKVINWLNTYRRKR